MPMPAPAMSWGDAEERGHAAASSSSSSAPSGADLAAAAARAATAAGLAASAGGSGRRGSSSLLAQAGGCGAAGDAVDGSAPWACPGGGALPGPSMFFACPVGPGQGPGMVISGLLPGTAQHSEWGAVDQEGLGNFLSARGCEMACVQLPMQMNAGGMVGGLGMAGAQDCRWAGMMHPSGAAMPHAGPVGMYGFSDLTLHGPQHPAGAGAGAAPAPGCWLPREGTARDPQEPAPPRVLGGGRRRGHSPPGARRHSSGGEPAPPEAARHGGGRGPPPPGGCGEEDLGEALAEWRRGEAQEPPCHSRPSSPHGARRTSGPWPREQPQEGPAHGSGVEDLGTALAQWRSSKVRRAWSLDPGGDPSEREPAAPYRRRARSAFPGAAARRRSSGGRRGSSSPAPRRRPQLRPAALELLQGLLRTEAACQPCAPGPGVPPAPAPAPALATPRAASPHAEPEGPMRLVAVRDGACQTDAEAVDVCVICLLAPRTHASLPCGHRCWCRGCAERQLKRAAHMVAQQGPRSGGVALSCPLCREPSSLGLIEIMEAKNAKKLNREDIAQKQQEQASPKLLPLLLGDREPPAEPVLAQPLAEEAPQPTAMAAAAASPAAAPPERRRRARAPPQRRRVQGEALAQLQQVLLANTAKMVQRRSPCAEEEAECQTECWSSQPCAGCSGRPVVYAAVPCGHQCLCETCGSEAQQRGGLCPVCGASAELGFFRIYG